MFFHVCFFKVVLGLRMPICSASVDNPELQGSFPSFNALVLSFCHLAFRLIYFLLLIGESKD